MNKTTYSSKKVMFYIICFTLSLMSFNTIAQTPGSIYDSATPTTNPMDPDGDEWITISGSAFVTDDQAESEVPYEAIPQVGSEPSGDLSTGSTCGPTDIVDDPSTGADGSYFYISDPNGTPSSGDELLQFRLRIAKDPGNGAFGFSVLVDTDILFGSNDLNSVTGNPGFEYEIRLKSGGGAGIFVDDVDGTTNGTNLTSFNIATNSQRSYALLQDISCTSDVVFYDFYITLSSLGLTDTSNFRLIAATASSPGSVLGSASDIGGVDDNDVLYNGDQDVIFEAVIDEQGNGLNIDSDGDGTKDDNDVDDDNDGIADLDEGYGSNAPFGDEDGDGTLNWEDTTDDGNSGDSSTTDYTDSNTNGIPDVYDTDGDGAANHLDLDSDNDGINDADEGGDGALDTNDDGLIDSNDAGFADANTNGQADDSEASMNPDTDGDMALDSVDLDSDNDGINDIDESGNGTADTSGDGMANGPDSDGDGIQDSIDADDVNFGEGASGDADVQDTDGDNTPDYIDLDSDNDGINDIDESGNGTADTSGDGMANGPDSDGDGIQDSIDADDVNFGEGVSGDADVQDTDGDNTPDHIDLDSDNDGVLDIVEGGNGGADTNGDGVVDVDDTNGNDTDGDGIPDAIDDDPNNIGDTGDAGVSDDISDSTDANSGGSGAISGADNDGDGIPVPTDNNDSLFGLNDGTLGIEGQEIIKFVAYPNPATDNVTLAFDNNFDTLKVSIYSITGQLVYSDSSNVQNRKKTLNISHLSSGIYILSLKTERAVKTLKLIVNK